MVVAALTVDVSARSSPEGVPWRWFIAAVVVAVALFAGAFIGHRVRTADERLADRISARIDHAAKRGRPVELRGLTAAHFDRMAVVGPALTPAEIRSAVGFDWGRADLLYEDACCDPGEVWAFVRGKHVIAVVAPSDLIAGGDTLPLGAYSPSAHLTFRAGDSSKTWKLGIVDDCGAFGVKGSDFVGGCSRAAIPK